MVARNYLWQRRVFRRHHFYDGGPGRLRAAVAPSVTTSRRWRGVDAATRARRFLHHDTTYADVVGQYLLFAASSLLGLVLLALLLKALDELLQKRLSKGIDRVAAGVLAMRRRYSSEGSRGRRRGRRASGSRDDSRTSSTSA